MFLKGKCVADEIEFIWDCNNLALCIFFCITEIEKKRFIVLKKVRFFYEHTYINKSFYSRFLIFSKCNKIAMKLHKNAIIFLPSHSIVNNNSD